MDAVDDEDGVGGTKHEEVKDVGGECEVDESRFEIDAIQEEDDVEDDHQVDATDDDVPVANGAALIAPINAQPPPTMHASNVRPLATMSGEMSDWVACVNSDGDTYYCNLVTNETMWEPPFEPLPLVLSDRPSSHTETSHSLGRTSDSTTVTSTTPSVLPPADPPEARPLSSSSSASDKGHFIKRVLNGSLRRLDPHTQMQLEEARRRHRELEELRDEEVQLGGEHWVEMYDPTHDGFYYYGTHSGEMRWDKPDSYVMQVGSDDILRMVVRVQCAFRMKHARRKVFQLKLQRGLIHPGGSRRSSGSWSSPRSCTPNPWVEVYDPFHKVLYYYCAATNETQWDPPDQFISAAEDREMAAAIAIQSMSRSHLARRDVKKRKATIRKKQLELHMEETRRLRELRRRDYAAKTDDERERICRREMLEEEMDQIRDGDSYWGRDRHDQEVIRQQMEEKLLADAESFWQRVNVTMSRRVEMEMIQRSQSLDAGRSEMELISEAHECDRMRAAENDQCVLGDSFWGIQAEERHEEQTRREMDTEQERSRQVGAKDRIEELYCDWTRDKANQVESDKIKAVVDEKRHQRQYFQWFYHQCETADDVLDYLWPTKQRFEPRASPEEDQDGQDNQEFVSDSETPPGAEQPQQLQQSHTTMDTVTTRIKEPTFVLDDIVLRERLETDYRYGGKSIYTIHDPNAARVLGRRGRYVVSHVSTDGVYAEASKMADRKPRPTSPTRPMPQSSKRIPNDTLDDENERIRYGMFPALHFNHRLDRTASSFPSSSPRSIPDPHIPARYNGVPYQSSDMDETQEILLGHHTKLTQLPSLPEERYYRQQHHESSPPGKPKPKLKIKPSVFGSPPKKPFGSPHGVKSTSKHGEKTKNKPKSKVKDSSLFLAMQETNNNAVDPLSSSLGFASPFFRDAQAANRPRFSHSTPLSEEERAAREAQEQAQRVRRQLEAQFKREELSVVREVFLLIDADESGTINKKELVWALQRDGEVLEIANKSALLRLLLKQPAHLEELFRHLRMSDAQRDEISWDIFRVFCEEMYISLMQQGILTSSPLMSANHGNTTNTKSAPRKAKGMGRGVRHTKKGSVFTEATEEQLIRRVFALCDQDANGVLEIEELQQALYKSVNPKLQALVETSKALRPLLHEATFIDAFRKFEPLDPRGISEEEFVVLCLEIADLAMLNGML